MKKVTLVTGASRGLGACLAREFARSGYRAAINYRAGRPLALRVSRTISRHGGEAICIQADVGLRDEVDAMVNEVISRWGRLDVLVNNAGINSESLLVTMSENAWDRVMETNLKGAFNCAGACARRMVAQRSGHIINICSIAGVWGARGGAAYAASKAALIGLTKSLAAELGGCGIRVNAVIPGFMLTRMSESSAEKILDNARGMSPLGKLSDPRVVARFIVQLAGMDTVTGQLFSCDGRIFRWA